MKIQKICIFIIVHNGEWYIRTPMGSVQNQNFTEIKIIIILRQLFRRWECKSNKRINERKSKKSFYTKFYK